MKSIISIILIAASIAFFVFFTKPKWAELKANRLEVEKLNIAEDNAKALKERIKTLEDARKSISEADTIKITKMVPDNVENVKLIIDFEKMLQSLVEENKTADIYKALNKDSSGEMSIESPKIVQGNTVIEGKFDATQLGVADFSFRVSLTYSDFLDFLRRIETSTRIFDVESISFSAPTASAGAVKNPSDIVYDFNITLKTYWLKSK